MNHQDHVLNAELVGDIHAKRHRLPANTFDHPYRVNGGPFVDITNRDHRSFLGKLERGRLANAPPRTCNDRHLTC